MSILDEGESLEVWLGKLGEIPEEVEDEFLKESGKILKKNVKMELSKYKTKTSRPGYKHMADDVVARVVRDEFGGKVVRVRGGRKTGTKWHLINDGAYTVEATHFMDTAYRNSDQEIQKALDRLIRGLL